MAEIAECLANAFLRERYIVIDQCVAQKSQSLAKRL